MTWCVNRRSSTAIGCGCGTRPKPTASSSLATSRSLSPMIRRTCGRRPTASCSTHRASRPSCPAFPRITSLKTVSAGGRRCTTGTRTRTSISRGGVAACSACSISSMWCASTTSAPSILRGPFLPTTPRPVTAHGRRARATPSSRPFVPRRASTSWPKTSASSPRACSTCATVTGCQAWPCCTLLTSSRRTPIVQSITPRTPWCTPARTTTTPRSAGDSVRCRTSCAMPLPLRPALPSFRFRTSWGSAARHG